MKPALKNIAWNHIRLTIPLNWEIGRIGTHQLMFQDDSRPRLELKWHPIKGKFSHQAHLKRLTARHKNALQHPIEPWPLPVEWENALPGFTSSGFMWRSEKSIGRGLILYCPHCRQATLLQFFFNGPAGTSSVPRTILESFKDHRDDGLSDWFVFDIRATLPEKFTLSDHRFQPGNYELKFSNGTQTIHLLRWAPASALLTRGTLARFAQAISGMGPENVVSRRIKQCPGVEGSFAPASKKNRWLQRFMPKPVFQLWRLWHLEEKNRILGIKIEDSHAIDPQLADILCEAYDTFP